MRRIYRAVGRETEAQAYLGPLDECEIFTFKKRLGTGLTIEPLKIGFVVKQFQLARGTDHVEINDAFGSARKVWWEGAERVVGSVQRTTLIFC